MQPKTSSGKGKSREEIIGEQARFLQERTPPVFDLEMVSKKYPTSYEESMNTVLFQECVRYNGLLSVMKVQLVKVQMALVGELVMSEDLEAMATSIYDNQVPAEWQQSGNGSGFLSLKPLASWIIDCNERIDFLTNWIDNGTPIVYWISGFFFPQAFLTGTMQNYARKEYIAVDKISFRYDVKDHLSKEKIKEKPEAGCLIYGMYIEGCKWNYDTHSLDESDPKKLFVEMPMVHLMPVADREIPKTGIYDCPVYKVLTRSGTLSTTGHSTNFVIFMELPTD
jgi:dynein heavy chain, axonemal